MEQLTVVTEDRRYDIEYRLTNAANDEPWTPMGLSYLTQQWAEDSIPAKRALLEPGIEMDFRASPKQDLK